MGELLARLDSKFHTDDQREIAVLNWFAEQVQLDLQPGEAADDLILRIKEKVARDAIVKAITEDDDGEGLQTGSSGN